jgi:hypothetical protein
MKSRQGTSFLRSGHWVVACEPQQRHHIRRSARTRLEGFAEPRLALWHKVFDPSACSLTKSQKLGLGASNSLRFAHRGGPFVSHRLWLGKPTAQRDGCPKNLMITAFRGYAKLLTYSGPLCACVGPVRVPGSYVLQPFARDGLDDI